ncbi:MAG: flagellar biosynthetic protein FliO [Gammaproteobacteria bacterium]
MRRWIDRYSLQDATRLVALAWMPGARANSPEPAAVFDIGAGPGLLQILMNLLLVLGAVVLLAWLFKKLQHVNQPGSSSLRVHASLALGPRDRLLVVAVGEEQILIGASSNGIEKLHVLKEPLSEATPAVSFKERLGQMTDASKS